MLTIYIKNYQIFAKQKKIQINSKITSELITELTILFQKIYHFKVKNVNLLDPTIGDIDKDKIKEMIDKMDNNDIKNIGNLIIKNINDSKIKSRVIDYNKKILEEKQK